MHERIEESWTEVLTDEFTKPYFIELTEKIRAAYITSTIYPPPKQLFGAFTLCPFKEVKVVILGQDPYHGPGQAHGLAFSVADEVRIPPSLRNIYKEMRSDVGAAVATSGDLSRLATQGVLLLNTSLTVESGAPASHADWGWHDFTDAVIEIISDKKEHVVFLLWGSHAIAKASLIDTKKHLVLSAPHPSPLSAHRGFFGCRHFSQTNAYLQTYNKKPIKW